MTHHLTTCGELWRQCSPGASAPYACVWQGPHAPGRKRPSPCPNLATHLADLDITEPIRRLLPSPHRGWSGLQHLDVATEPTFRR